MSIPPEIAWIIPVVLPLIIGLLVGAIIKKGFKLELPLHMTVGFRPILLV
jgi:hypothetical protein